MLRQLRTMATVSDSISKPMEHSIRQKLAALSPTTLEIHNDSHLHAHHKAMATSTSSETHFRVTLVTPMFQNVGLAARHRMVYRLLREEMDAPGGIHALQLRCKTAEEVERDEQGVRKLKREQ